MIVRGLTFGAVASMYERFRPGYPHDLVDCIQEYARRPIATALEIGAGTGKATRVFAQRGIAVTATDPDPSMLAVLRQHVPDSVEVVQGALEDLHLNRTFDLVFAAASLHWTDPEHRWARVVEHLAPGGVFASIGGQRQLDDPDLRAAVSAAGAPYVDDHVYPSPDGTPESSPMQWPGTELQRTGLFTDVQQTVVVRRRHITAPEYIGHLSTVSAYLQLPQDQREEALSRIRAVLPERIKVVSDINVHLARRGTTT